MKPVGCFDGALRHGARGVPPALPFEALCAWVWGLRSAGGRALARGSDGIALRSSPNSS
jgi:hypothetical protein